MMANHLSRKLRLKKLRALLPLCPFVDFKDNEYKLLFPYPLVRQYVEFDNEGRIVNVVTGDGITHIDSGSLVKSTVRQEITILGKKMVGRVNRRINYLYDRYLVENSRDYIGNRGHKGRSRDGYDANSIANKEANKIVTDFRNRRDLFIMEVK